MSRSSQLVDFTRAAIGRGMRGAADLRRRTLGLGSAKQPLAIFGRRRSLDLDSWNVVTEQRHDAYRQACPPAAGRLAVVCSSNRVSDLPTLVASVARQTLEDFELVFVAHGLAWDLDAIEGELAVLEHRVRLLTRPASVSLGACLNAAMADTDARFIAKFDSDDHYGPEYLADALRAHRFAGAGIVGKHSYYGHLAASDEYILRFPGNEFRYSSTLAGGTLVIDRDVVDDQPFADVSLGEDFAYIRACHRRWISTFSADRFNYTQVRSGSNTWPISDARFAEKSLVVAPTSGRNAIDR